jgi:hypothetical protein
LVYFPHFGVLGPRKIWQPCQKSRFGYILEGLGIENVGIFARFCMCFFTKKSLATLAENPVLKENFYHGGSFFELKR